MWSDSPLDGLVIPSDASDADPRVYIGSGDPLVDQAAEGVGVAFYTESGRGVVLSSRADDLEGNAIEFVATLVSQRGVLALLEWLKLRWNTDAGDGDGPGSGSVTVGQLPDLFTAGSSYPLGVNLAGRSINIIAYEGVPAIGETTPGEVRIDGNLSVTGVGSEILIRTTTVTVTNSVALVDIPGALVTLAPGATYFAEVLIAYNALAAADARFAWTVSDASLMNDRHILSLGASTTTNVDSTMTHLRRAPTTQQVVGGPSGVASSFSVHRETCIMSNPTATVQTLQMQFAQGTANATGSVAQNGYILLKRVE